MLSNRLTGIFKTLSFRLALLYAGMFLGSSIIVFVITFFALTLAMDKRVEKDLIEEANEYRSILSLQGLDYLKTSLRIEAESTGVKKIYLRIIDLEGREIFSTDASHWKHVSINKKAIRTIAKGNTYPPRKELLQKPNRKIFISYNLIGEGIILQISQSVKDNDEFIELFRNTFWGIMGIMIPLSLAVGWTMARRSMRGVEAVAQTAEAISKGELNKRVNVKFAGTEIERLANTFNYMLDRIDRLIFGIKEVTDNIAHDLKIPITRIRGLAEVTLNIGKGDKRYKSMAASTIEESDHLIQLINTLLDISERTAGVSKPTIKEFDLVESVHRVCELFEPLAEEKNILFSNGLPPHCAMTGDALGIQRLIINIVDNSFKYTPSKGKISISVHNQNDKVKIIVDDTGLGISKEDLPFIFERFFRCNKSRSDEGFGLGLSLAETIAKYHGGTIIANSELGQGSTFTITLNRHQEE